MCDISQSRIKKACREWVNCVIARAHHHNFFFGVYACGFFFVWPWYSGEKGGFFLSCERENDDINANYHHHTTATPHTYPKSENEWAKDVLWECYGVTLLSKSREWRHWNIPCGIPMLFVHLSYTIHIFFFERGSWLEREEMEFQLVEKRTRLDWNISNESWSMLINLHRLNIDSESGFAFYLLSLCCFLLFDMWWYGYMRTNRHRSTSVRREGREWAALRDDEFSSPHHVHTGAFRVVCERERERTHIRQPKRYQQAYYQFNIIPLKFEVWFPFKAERKLFKFSFS